MISLLENITTPVFLSEASPEIIKEIQQILGVQADGICGIKTLTAFYEFKSTHHLAEPNILGPTTAKKLLAREALGTEVSVPRASLKSKPKKIVKTSQLGIDLIKSFEGLNLESYKCPANIWTIGYGTTKNIKPGMKITALQAEEFLRQDVAEFEEAIALLVKVPLTQNQFDAIASLIYNIGIGSFAGSTLLKKLNLKNYKGAADEFIKWCHGGGKILPGLLRRRKAEKVLFLQV